MHDSDYEPLKGLASLMTLSINGADLSPIGVQLIERARRNPADANALMDLSTVLQLKWDVKAALATQHLALSIQQLYRLPAPQTANGESPIRVLALMAPGDLMANAPLEFFVEGCNISLDMLYVGPGLPYPPVAPEHDVLFFSVGESDQNRPLLNQLSGLIANWPRPVINSPERSLLLSRDAACSMLRSAPGVMMPISARIDRESLQEIANGELTITDFLEDGVFPIIARPIGSHAGRGLCKLEDPSAVSDYLQTMPQPDFYISRFVDYRSQDGLFRKYRIILIEGRPFVCHMGISSHWMIHYLNAGMTDSADKRAEEERFMADFDASFAVRHQRAFSEIHERMGLDYLGIDCAESPDGQLLIFEVDTGMVVHAIDPVDLFPYKQPQMRKVFAAFRRMLINAIDKDARSLPMRKAATL